MRNIIVVLTISCTLVSSALGQGALNPLAAPAPMMKSLDQVEARIPITSVPVSLNESGSYYFVSNLVLNAGSLYAINVDADHVTIDMNGFSLTSASNVTASGIRVWSGKTFTLMNGAIVGNTRVLRTGSGPFVFTVEPGGFDYGTIVNTADCTVLVKNMHFNHCRTTGLSVGTLNAAVIMDSLAMENGTYGFYGSNFMIKNSNAYQNGDTGIKSGNYAMAKDCVARLNGVAGIDLGSLSLKVDCLENVNGP